ncbi:MAG TPA: alpha/beta fold hydrolase [Chromatiaceae bacterium]|nr:alpha/beta fold hydrolase [Chromatiaceae bacterium]
MLYLRNLFISLLLAFLPLQKASAEIAILVHGYLSDAGVWERSGVNASLRGAGWQHAGNLSFSPAGLVEQPITGKQGEKLFYTVNLPSLASAPAQASWLKAAVDHISRKNPDQSITLVGHSAGGVIARLILVQYGQGNVDRLITIAAPHIGTDKAIRALDAVDDSGMFGMIKEWFVRDEIGDGMYHTLKASRGILFNLVPPAPGTLLFWLNAQPHPDIDYVSVIRSGGYVIAGDLVVPPFSQDMNMIPALRGKAKRWLSFQGHELTPNDGRLLAEIL